MEFDRIEYEKIDSDYFTFSQIKCSIEWNYAVVFDSF